MVWEVSKQAFIIHCQGLMNFSETTPMCVFQRTFCALVKLSWHGSQILKLIIQQVSKSYTETIFATFCFVN